MKKLILFLSFLAFATVSFAQTPDCPYPSPTPQNAKWRFMFKQCFDSTLRLKYADTSKVAYINSQGDLVTITYAALLDSLDVPGLDSTIFATVHYVNERAEQSDSLANTKGWIFPPPDSFAYRPPFSIIRNPETGEYSIDPNFDLRFHANIRNTGTTYYVSVETGSDANSGLTPALPLKTLVAAMQKSDVSTIMLAPGYYYNRYSWRSIIPANSIEFIGTGDSVILTNDYRDVLTFTADGNLYKAFTDTMPSQLWDRLKTDQFGDPKTLKLYTSKAQVDTATVGAYFYGANDTLYVRLQDFRAPDSFMSVFTPVFNIRMSGDGKRYYFKRIMMYGGALFATNLSGVSGGVKVYVDSCSTRGGANTFDGTSDVILFNSSFAKVKNADVINYDPQNGVVPDFIEYNCNVYNTMDLDYTPGTSDQASTAHNMCRGLRLNSRYSYTNGQCIADVNGCQSWLVNCTADSSISTGSSGFFFGTGASFGRAWLQECTSIDVPPSGFDVTASTNSKVHVNGLISTTYDYSVSGQLDSNYHYQLYTPMEEATVWEMLDNFPKVPAGTTGQTGRWSGGIFIANSFFTNTGTDIGIGTSTPLYRLHIENNTGDVTFGMRTTTAGVATIFTQEGPGALVWNLGWQSTHNSGAFVIHTGGITSTTPRFTISRIGNAGFGTSSLADYKVNINGSTNMNGSVSIGGGIGSGLANASAALTINSTTQGFLPPVMTAAQASAIASPATGLLVYVTSTNGTFTSTGWWGHVGAGVWEKLNN